MTTHFSSSLRSTVVIALVSMGLAACGDEGSSPPDSVVSATPSTGTTTGLSTGTSTGSASGTISRTSGTSSPPAGTSGSTSASGSTTSVITPVTPGATTVAQTAPQISGTSVTSVNAGARYQFKPQASGPQGTTLSFSIQNKPEWATFDAASGLLSGTPTAANVGTYSNIIVSVSDGEQSASLSPFSVAVNQMSEGAVTLDWTPPTTNTDGSALTNLVGYTVYYGTSANNLSQSVKVSNPGLSSYTVSNLSSGAWYFAVAAVSSSGSESALSGVVSTSL